MEKFHKEFKVGEIHVRDRWQFELKSDFFPHPSLTKHSYTQEFYLFIPNSLQINQETYPKKQFYHDQLNLIRYKTPEFTLKQLLDKQNRTSPLFRINEYLFEGYAESITEEIKLLANIVRSSFRARISQMLELIKEKEWETLQHDVSLFCQDLQKLREELLHLKKSFFIKTTLKKHFSYADEFISDSYSYYLTGLINELQTRSPNNHLQIIDQLKSRLLEEQEYRDLYYSEPSPKRPNELKDEFILYRRGLLNKFILDALLLDINRFSLGKTFRNLIGAFSAGIAMTIYLLLFIWQGEVFLTNSEPFILFTVIIYILKDRIKDGLKTISFRRASKWFSDYTTEIRSPDSKSILGKLKETVSFILPKSVPKEIIKIRNLEFHSHLESFIRPETVIYYKKKFYIMQTPQNRKSRRIGFNIIFRFNIRKFLEKASEPTHTYYSLDRESKNLTISHLPKVYHLNIIMRNVYTREDLTTKIELKKFRLIVDKKGIKRVEHIG